MCTLYFSDSHLKYYIWIDEKKKIKYLFLVLKKP